jgi:hypothetical protein
VIVPIFVRVVRAGTCAAEQILMESGRIGPCPAVCACRGIRKPALRLPAGWEAFRQVRDVCRVVRGEAYLSRPHAMSRYGALASDTHPTRPRTWLQADVETATRLTAQPLAPDHGHTHSGLYPQISGGLRLLVCFHLLPMLRGGSASAEGEECVDFVARIRNKSCRYAVRRPQRRSLEIRCGKSVVNRP